MRTSHQYIDHYPIEPDSTKLILGTIHPHDHQSFKMPFFYGNKLSIWKILHEVFPDELVNPADLEGVKAFLHSHKISISDTIRTCTRTNNSALDEGLVPEQLNYGLLPAIRDSNINHILFTSGFGTNNAFRLFYENILGQNITADIRQNKGCILDKAFSAGRYS